MYPFLILYLFFTLYVLWDEYNVLSRHRAEVSQYYAASTRSLQQLEDLEPLNTTHVSVFHLERVLTTWDIQNRPWHGYQAAVGFKVSFLAGGPTRYNVVEFSARVPLILQGPTILKSIPYLLSGADNFLWDNQGAIFFTPHDDSFPTEYSKTTKLGTLNGSEYNQVRQWILKYAVQHRTFEPLEAASLPSHTSHDFTTAIIREMQVVALLPQQKIYRDRLIIYSSPPELVEADDPELQQYFDKFQESGNFAEAQNTLKSSTTQIHFIYSGEKYYKILLKSPWLNYCYTEIANSEDSRCLFQF